MFSASVDTYEPNFATRETLVVIRKRRDQLSSRLLNIGTDDGLCAIDITVDPERPQHDISDYLQITNAASAVLQTCVNTQASNTGGVVKQLGTF